MVLRPPRLQRQQRPPGWRGTGSDCRDRKDCCTRCARSTCGGRVRFALCASTDAGAGTSGCRAWCPRRSQCDRCVRTLRPPLPSRTQHSMPLQPLPRPQAPLLPPHQPACAPLPRPTLPPSSPPPRHPRLLCRARRIRLRHLCRTRRRRRARQQHRVEHRLLPVLRLPARGSHRDAGAPSNRGRAPLCVPGLKSEEGKDRGASSTGSKGGGGGAHGPGRALPWAA